MITAINLRGLSVAPIFLLIDHFFFCFSFFFTFCEKMEKICVLANSKFCSMHLFRALPLVVRRLQIMPHEGLSFMKRMATLGVINARNRPIYAKYDKMVCFPWLLFDLLYKNPVDHAEFLAQVVQSHGVFPFSGRKAGEPIPCISDTSKSNLAETIEGHRDDVIECPRLCSETTRQRLVDPIEYWKFSCLLSMV